jgi:thiamine pyrophosphate-dependent acetolactate synthase large subunit-like protein
VLGHVDALRAFARAANIGVVNTWGAKGVFAWDDPLHFATAGLQARDFELAGLLDLDVVITVGLDPREITAPAWRDGAEVVDLAPEELATARFIPSAEPPTRPRLYTELAAALAPLYASDAVPLTPARAAADLAAALPAGGLVTADPAPVGLWVARAFPTREPGSVVVPATSGRGRAAALALSAAREGRPVVLVTDEVDEVAIESARRDGLSLVVEVWGAGGEPAGRVAPGTPGVHVVPVPVDLTWTRVLVAVAGEVVAWRD